MLPHYRKYSGILILVYFVISPFIAYAQPDPPPDPTIPINGAIGLLLAAGALLGVKKLFGVRKDN